MCLQGVKSTRWQTKTDQPKSTWDTPMTRACQTRQNHQTCFRSGARRYPPSLGSFNDLHYQLFCVVCKPAIIIIVWNRSPHLTRVLSYHCKRAIPVVSNPAPVQFDVSRARLSGFVHGVSCCILVLYVFHPYLYFHLR